MVGYVRRLFSAPSRHPSGMALGRVCTGQYANVYRGSSVLLIHRDRLQIIIARLIAIIHFEANLSLFFSSHATTEDVEVLIKKQRDSPPVSRTQRSCSERKRVFQNKRLRRFTEPQGNARFIVTRPFLLVFAPFIICASMERLHCTMDAPTLCTSVFSRQMSNTVRMLHEILKNAARTASFELAIPAWNARSFNPFRGDQNNNKL